MTDKKQEQVLEEYLQGKSGISRRYQSEAKQQPDKQLDDAILAAARKAAGSKPRVLHKIYQHEWYKPVSWAAVLVICVSVVFNIYKDSDQELLTAPTPDISPDKPATERSDADIDTKRDTAGKSQPESVQNLEKKNTGIKAAKPEDIDMIWQQESKQLEDIDDSKPRAAAPAMGEQVMQDKVLRREAFDAPVDQQDEIMPGDEASAPVMEESIPERAKIRSDQVEMDISEMRTITAEPETENMTPEQWLEHISLLWSQGNKERAKESLKQFLEIYPEYPAENIREKLPEGLNLSEYIN